jgi:hypothetical protein
MANPDPRKGEQPQPWNSQPQPLTNVQSGQAPAPGMQSSTAMQSNALADRFSHNYYHLQKKYWKLLGGAFSLFDANGNLVLYSQLKAFKLKEDIRIFADEQMQTEVVSIKARQILDWGATYDVVDSTTGQKVGAMRRKALKSMVQDEWVFLNAADQEIGTLKEESTALALVRRFVEFATYFLPQKYIGEIGGRQVCAFQQTYNPFVYKLNMDFSLDPSHVLDRHLGIAAAILLAAIEGKQR